MFQTTNLAINKILEELKNLVDMNSRVPYPIEELIHNDHIVYVVPFDRHPLTKKRLEFTYNQSGELIDKTQTDPDWARTELAPFQRVYSVGVTPEEAIKALGVKVGWENVKDFKPQFDTTDECWYYRFTVDGTSMKAGGRFVPGGVILDWWK